MDQILNRKWTIAVAFVLIFLYGASFSHAQAVRTFSWQGILTQNGQPISAGKHNFNIKLYPQPTGGSPIFQEDQEIIVTGGMVNLEIGAASPVPLSFATDTNYYLGLGIDGGEELQPRTHITSQPLAFHALTADRALALEPGAKGVVASVNGMEGALTLEGDSTITISKSATGFTFTAHPPTQSVSLHSVQSADSSILIALSSGDASISVRDSGVTTRKLRDASITSPKIADKTVTLQKLSVPSAAQSGAVIKWSGTQWVYAQDSIAAYKAGPGILISQDTIRSIYPPPSITLLNSTLRSSSTGWVEDTAVLANASGDITAHSISLDGPSVIGTGGSLLPSGTGIITANSYTGTLSVANGGTGLSTIPAGQLLIGNGTGALKATTLSGVNGIVVSGGDTIGLLHSLPSGRVINSLLHWDGTAWLEDTSILATSGGTLSAASLTLSGKATSQSTLVTDPGSTLVTKDYVANNTSVQTDSATLLGDGISANRIRLNLAHANIWSGNQTIASGAALAPTGTGTVTANQFIGSGSTTTAVDLATAEVSGVLQVSNGGTGATSLTDHAVILGGGTQSLHPLSLANGQLLIGSTGADPAAGTLTAGTGVTISNGSGTITISATGLVNGTTTNSTLRWNGTNWIENTGLLANSTGGVTAQSLSLSGKASSSSTSSGDPGSTLVTKDYLTSLGGLLVPVQNGGTGSTSLTANGILIGNGTNAVASQVLSNGQLLIGSTGAAPVATTLTAGSGVTISNSAGAINISATGLANGTTTNSTMRWNGTSWVENTAILGSSSGALSAQSIALNGKATAASTTASDVAGTLVTKDYLSSPSSGIVATQLVGTGSTTGAVDLATAEVNGILPVANGGTGLSSLTANAVLIGNGSGTPTSQSLSNGQLLVGSTGSGPVAATLTAGSGILVTNAAGAITISAPGSVANGSTTNSSLRWNGTAWVENASVLQTSLGAVSAATMALTGKATSASTLETDGGSTLVTKDFVTTAGTVPVTSDGTTLLGNGTTSNSLSLNLGRANVWTAAQTFPGISIAGVASPITLGTSSGTVGQVLTSQGATTTPAWQNVSALIGSVGFDKLSNGTNTTAALIVGSGASLTTSGTGYIAATRFAGTGSTSDAVDLATGEVAGTLSVANGGTGIATLPANAVLIGNGSSISSQSLANGQLLIGSTGAAPISATLTAGSGIAITNSSGGISIAATGSLPSGTGTNSTLRYNGTSWVENTSVTVTAAGALSGTSLGLSGKATSASTSSSDPGTTLVTKDFLATLSYPIVSDNASILGDGTSGNTVRLNTGNSNTWTTNQSFSNGLTLPGTTSPFTTSGSSGTSGFVLSSQGSNSSPQWVNPSTLISALSFDKLTTGTNNAATFTIATGASISVTGTGSVTATQFKGTLPVANGGTNGSAVPTAGGVPYGDGTQYQFTGAGTAGQVLTSAGAGAPQWLAPGGATGWNLTGNNGTVAGTNFIGTNDNTAFEIHVHNIGSTADGRHRVMRFEPQDFSPNIIGGFNQNAVTASVVGAIIAGGGDSSEVNTVTDNFGTVSGGKANRAGDGSGTVSTAQFATVGGGAFNSAKGQYATIGGGHINVINEPYGTIAGGDQNVLGTASTGDGYSVIGGGDLNTATGTNSSILGGHSNTASGGYAAVAGGSSNSATGTKSFIGAGASNAIQSTTSNSSIAGGNTNTVMANESFIGGGYSNYVYSDDGVVGGGAQNSAGQSGFAKTYATVAGGFRNAASGQFAGVTGGNSDTASANYAFVGGGYTNAASGLNAAVGAGSANKATSNYSFIGGGETNTASGVDAVVAGGNHNSATAIQSSVLGGLQNYATGTYSAIVGGEHLTVGDNTFGYSASLSSFDVSSQSNIAYFGDVSLIIGNDDNAARELRWYGPNNGGTGTLGSTHYTALKAGSPSSNTSYTLPVSLPATTGELLTSSTTGTMSWTPSVIYDATNTRLGVNVAAPNTTLDVNGDVAVRLSALSLSGTSFDDQDLPATSIVRISGPTADFTITGFTGGVNGKIVVVYNSTSHTMTFALNSTSSQASNRIVSGATVSVGQYGTVQLFYSGTDSRWVVMAKN